MPRLRHKTTGVVVSVDDDTAALLVDYEPADAGSSAGSSTAKTQKRPAAKKTTSEPQE